MIRNWLMCFGLLLSACSVHAENTAPLSKKQKAAAAYVLEWKKRYYMDKQPNQEHISITVSFIAYLMRQAPEEKILNYELELVKKYFPKLPNYMHLSLIKVYKNAYVQAYKDAMKTKEADEPLEITRCAWKQALLGYYESLYSQLKEKTYQYGWRKGRTLPEPAAIRKRIADKLALEQPCTDEN
jgi:hypothetical protein